MSKSKVLSIIMIFFLCITLLGLMVVQIVMHERYQTMSEQNRLKIVPLNAPRGTIKDRNGYDMVKDELSFNVSIKHSRLKKEKEFLRNLSAVLGGDVSNLEEDLKNASRNPFAPYVIARDIGIERAVRVSEMSMEYPGLMLDVSPKRRYLTGRSGSTFLGYTGPINREEFQRLRPYGFRIDDRMGRAGIEIFYDDYLRGRHGGKQVEVDNRGREVKVLGHREPVSGKSLRLTVDSLLQNFCDELLEGRRGAIVVMSPENGGIMALSSAPTYDPNAFIEEGRGREVMGYMRDEKYPLLNRSVSGVYPSGSVFKLLIATAALDSGAIMPGTVFGCSGSLMVGGRTFSCWRKEGHGEIELSEAIKVSCNIYFWRTGLLLGSEKISAYGSRLGIGARSGIDLPYERPGLLPSESWKKKVMKEQWYRGDTLNLSVGQGDLLVTPIQIARMTSAFANGGYLVRPYIVEEIDGMPFASREKLELGLSRSTIDAVKEGMKRAVNMRRGTGVRARNRDIIVSGKTGTAQTSTSENHGWFAGFAPFESPRAVVVVLDEYGGKGGDFAAETAGKIFSKAQELGLI